jgi:lincosamide nucleotidyltransferase A/C/D/E
VEAGDVVDVLDALETRGLKVWVDGGWGVDALLGQQTRQHDDLDLVVELVSLPGVLEALEGLGFSLAEDLAPTRVVVRAADGRQVDLHPVTFDQEGTAWQFGASADGSDCPYPAGGLDQGRILDRAVPCLGPELQIEHHRGYVPRDRDRLDMANLARHFNLSPPGV